MFHLVRHNFLFMPLSTSTDGDTLLFINFRADRVRQITEALGITRHFDTSRVPQDLVRGV